MFHVATQILERPLPPEPISSSEGDSSENSIVDDILDSDDSLEKSESTKSLEEPVQSTESHSVNNSRETKPATTFVEPEEVTNISDVKYGPSQLPTLPIFLLHDLIIKTFFLFFIPEPMVSYRMKPASEDARKTPHYEKKSRKSKPTRRKRKLFKAFIGYSLIRNISFILLPLPFQWHLPLTITSKTNPSIIHVFFTT